MEQRGHVEFEGAKSSSKNTKTHYLDLSSSSSVERNAEDVSSSSGEEGLSSSSSDGREDVRLRALGGDDDDEEEELDVEQQKGMGWGKNKQTFYQQDEDEVSSSEGERLEEEEAKRLQNKRANQMDEADYLDVAATVAPRERKKLKHQTAPDRTGGGGNETTELNALLEDVKEKVAEVRQVLIPLLADLGTDESSGISFLRLKYQLLLSYCMNLMYYMLLKVEGRPVADHPVIEQLVRLRVMIDRTKGIDDRLRPTVTRLLRAVAQGQDVTDGSHARANLQDMLLSDEEEEEQQQQGSGRYVAPKRTVMYAEDDDKWKEKQQKKDRRAREKATRSGIMKMVRDEFDEGPEVISSNLHVIEDDEEQPEDLERREYEEEHFVRLGDKKGSKKKGAVKYVDDLKALDDFGDVDRMLRMQKTSSAQPSTLSDAARMMLNGRQGEFANSDDGMLQEEDDNVKQSDLDKQQAYELYLKEANSQKSSKAKKEKYVPNPNARRTAQEVEVEGKRKIGYQIEANKGDRTGKTKDIARVRHKNKFKAAMKKHGTRVRKEPAGGYGGEASGISKNMVRSTKLK